MKNKVIKTGIKNTIYVVVSQTISLLLGIARTLLLPLLLGITNFGYWQVYLLYMAYVGIFSLGFNDGIYLKYGKYDYDDLPKASFRSSIRLFVIIQFLITILISAVILFEKDPSKQISMFWASINIPIAGLTGVLTYVLQITNQLKKYSFYTILDKIIVLIIILGVFIIKLDNFLIIIIADTLSRLMVLVLMVLTCKDIIFGKGIGYNYAVKEIFDNMRVGINLMLANFAGMLVLGFGRFLVERTASVEEYGIYSFAISSMNLVLVLITAIGLVIYPTLNRLDKNNYPNYFIMLNKVLLIIAFGLLVILFPLKIFISTFMEEYVGIFSYLSIIFAIIFVQSKMLILINPYYKLLRKESTMLSANLLGVLIAIILVVPTYMITKSVTLVAIGTLVAMLIRLYLSEIFLKKEQSIFNNINIIIEIVGLSLYILLGLISNLFIGFLAYLLIYSLFLLRQSKDIKALISYVIGR